MHGKNCALCRTGWTPTCAFNPKILAPTITRVEPLDFSVWTHVEKKACKTRHSNTDELKASVNRAWRSIRKDFVRKICKSFRSRLEHVIAASDCHSEQSGVFRYIAMLFGHISLCYKSCLMSLQMTLL